MCRPKVRSIIWGSNNLFSRFVLKFKIRIFRTFKAISNDCRGNADECLSSWNFQIPDENRFNRIAWRQCGVRIPNLGIASRDAFDEATSGKVNPDYLRCFPAIPSRLRAFGQISPQLKFANKVGLLNFVCHFIWNFLMFCLSRIERRCSSHDYHFGSTMRSAKLLWTLF